jgi:hypothetical protein
LFTNYKNLVILRRRRFVRHAVDGVDESLFTEVGGEKDEEASGHSRREHCHFARVAVGHGEALGESRAAAKPPPHFAVDTHLAHTPDRRKGQHRRRYRSQIIVWRCTIRQGVCVGTVLEPQFKQFAKVKK